jgi:hypothetical protein
MVDSTGGNGERIDMGLNAIDNMSITLKNQMNTLGSEDSKGHIWVHGATNLHYFQNICGLFVPNEEVSFITSCDDVLIIP